MPKFHVVLDTNIYRKNPSRSDLAFQALERLCKAGIMKLHLPYIVEREFQTQQLAQYKKELDAAISGLDAIIRKGLSPTALQSTTAIRESLTAATPSILDDAVSALTNWAESLGADRHPITEKQAIAAMESYFQGKLPLKAPKNRDDIPDSFIFQTLVHLAGTTKPLVVVAEDEKIAQAAETLQEVKVFRSLGEFIESPEIQAEILDLDASKNVPALAELLKQYEAENNEISHLLEYKGSDKLVWRKVHSHSIPDDNHEATITGHYNAEDIELDFEGLHYYGYGEFGLPFRFRTTVTISYYIFKADYYSLDDKKSPSVSDHNDHYYEAEDEVSVNVSGMMKLPFPPAEMKTLSAENIEEHITIEIDSVNEIEMED